MMKTLAYRRTSALPAIAAALALSSTPLLAQQVQPQPVDTQPAAATTQPVTVPDAAPSVSDTTTATPSTSDTTSSSSPSTSSASDSTTALAQSQAKVTKRPTHVAAAKAAPVSHRALARTETAKASAPVAVPASVATRTPSDVSPVNTASQSAVKPVVDMNATKTQSTTTASAGPATKHDKTVPIAAGGVLALLAIGGTAAAMTRRRNDDEEDWSDEETMEDASAEPVAIDPDREPVIHDEQPAIVAPAASAFPWGNRQLPAGDQQIRNATDEDRRPGETWVERAYRGPSPANPSASLRTRLKRAAFFDKRERDAAAGLAEPVDTAAGLPQAMIEERERERA